MFEKICFTRIFVPAAHFTDCGKEWLEEGNFSAPAGDHGEAAALAEELTSEEWRQ